MSLHHRFTLPALALFLATVPPACVGASGDADDLDDEADVAEASAALSSPAPSLVKFGSAYLTSSLVATLVAPGDNLLGWDRCRNEAGGYLSNCVALSIGQQKDYSVYFVTPTTGVSGAVYSGHLVLDRVRVKITALEDLVTVTMTNAVTRTMGGSFYSYVPTDSIVAEVHSAGPGSYYATGTYKNAVGVVLGTYSTSMIASVIPGSTCAQEAATLEAGINALFALDGGVFAFFGGLTGATICVAGTAGSLGTGAMPACLAGLAVGTAGLAGGTFITNVMGAKAAALAKSLYEAACVAYGWNDDSAPGGVGGVGGGTGGTGSGGTGGSGGLGGSVGSGGSGGSGCPGGVAVGAVCMGGSTIYECGVTCCIDNCPGLIDNTCACTWDPSDCVTEEVPCEGETLPP